jgi:hypothetical protein
MLIRKPNLLFTLLLCSVTLSFVSCSKDDEIKELKLSTADAIVHTDSIAYAFDIVSGNGNYQVTVDQNGGKSIMPKAVVVGNHVSIDLIQPSTRLTITDAAGQSTNLTIISDNKSLEEIETTVLVSYGYYLSSNLSWGNGDYYIEGQHDDIASVNIDKKGHFIVKGLRPNGSVSLLISDRRGTTNYMTVHVGNGADITDKALTYSVSKGELKDKLTSPIKWGLKDRLTFPIKYGVGNWKIISCSKTFENPFTLVLPKDKYMEQDLLQVWAPESAEGPFYIQLEDQAKNQVTLTIKITK